MFKNLFKKDTKKETDFNQLFNDYYKKGKDYLKKDDYERAHYYFNMADGLSMSIEDLDVSEDHINECSDILGELEEENLILEKLIEEIENKSEDMTYEQITIWNLLTLCRLQEILQLFEDKDGCEIFKQIPQVIKTIMSILMDEANDEQLLACQDFLNDLYDFSDSKTYYDPHITVSLNDHNLQINDLSAADIVTSLDIFLDHEINNYKSVDPSDEFITDFIATALGILRAYYLRTTSSSLEDIPQVQKEIKRIWNDYELLINEPDEDKIMELIDTYKQINIFKE